MKIVLFGYRGKVGSALLPALEREGHEVRGTGRGEEPDLAGVDTAVDFTAPDAGLANAETALAAGMPVVV